MEVVHDDDAALHYEFDLAEGGDVGEGVTLDGDEVGPFRQDRNLRSRLPSQLPSQIGASRVSRVNELGVLEGADLILRFEKFGGGGGSGAAQRGVCLYLNATLTGWARL